VDRRQAEEKAVAYLEEVMQIRARIAAAAKAITRRGEGFVASYVPFILDIEVGEPTAGQRVQGFFRLENE
jgi:hypothetical protein